MSSGSPGPPPMKVMGNIGPQMRKDGSRELGGVRRGAVHLRPNPRLPTTVLQSHNAGTDRSRLLTPYLKGLGLNEPEAPVDLGLRQAGLDVDRAQLLDELLARLVGRLRVAVPDAVDLVAFEVDRAL